MALEHRQQPMNRALVEAQLPGDFRRCKVALGAGDGFQNSDAAIEHLHPITSRGLGAKRFFTSQNRCLQVVGRVRPTPPRIVAGIGELARCVGLALGAAGTGLFPTIGDPPPGGYVPLYLQFQAIRCTIARRALIRIQMSGVRASVRAADSSRVAAHSLPCLCRRVG